MTQACADRLVELRRAFGFSQEELAEKLGVSRQAVSKWERAESSPDTDNLIALARLYRVSLDELLGLASPQPEQEPDQEPEPPEPTPAADDLLPDGSYYEAERQKQEAERERRHHLFPYPMAVSLAYLVLGFVFHAWHPGWILFLTIPLYYMPSNQRRGWRLLGNPIVVTIIYLLLGFLCNLWHPGWLVFLLIPLLMR